MLSGQRNQSKLLISWSFSEETEMGLFISVFMSYLSLKSRLQGSFPSADFLLDDSSLRKDIKNLHLELNCLCITLFSRTAVSCQSGKSIDPDHGISHYNAHTIRSEVIGSHLAASENTLREFF